MTALDVNSETTGTEKSVPVISHLDYNNPDTWCDAAIYTYPDFDRAGYQKRLDELFGLSENNRSIVRLVWPGDIKNCYSKFYCSWNGLWGDKTELRAKYRYASIQIPGTPDVIDVPPARWILEQYNSPGQYLQSWEAARFDKNSGREIRPGAPEWGYYSHLWTFASHKGECCKEALENHMVCWGSYRRPDDQDIEILRQARQKRDADREIDTTKPLDNLTLEAIGKETNDRIAANEAKNTAILQEFVDEYAFELIEYFTGHKLSDIARKKFSIPRELKGKHKLKPQEEGMKPCDTASQIIVPYNV